LCDVNGITELDLFNKNISNLTYMGISINLNPDEAPSNLSTYHGVRFYARGNGSCYFLVETAEIVGSSISIAASASGFYKMCNTGVEDLFK